MIVVPDAGPIICLAGAGQLDVLDKLFAEVVVPRVVFDEVVVAGAGLMGADEAQAATWLTVVDTAPDPSLLDRLGRGEAAAIPLAERLNATLLVDDAVARSVAMSRGLPVIGTLGVLLRAKRDGLVEQLLPLIDRMESLGMFISVDLREQVLRLAGEADE